MAEVREFILQLQAEAERTIAQIDQYQRALALHAFTRIVQRTPVDTGRARLSWNPSRDTPDETVPPPGQYSAAAALGKAGMLRPSPQRLTDIHISSNLVYIGVLEDGHSQQAPAGMVAVTYAELQSLGPKI